MPKVEGLVSQLQFFVSMAVTDKRLRLGEYFRDFVFGSVRILRSLPWLQSDTLAALVNARRCRAAGCGSASNPVCPSAQAWQGGHRYPTAYRADRRSGAGSDYSA